MGLYHNHNYPQSDLKSDLELLLTQVQYLWSKPYLQIWKIISKNVSFVKKDHNQQWEKDKKKPRSHKEV